MEIKDDKLLINTAEVDSIRGAKPEPEERPVVRELSFDALVSKGGPGSGAAAGKMRSRITAPMSMAQFFDQATPCSGCKHFRNDKWQDMLTRWSQSTNPLDRAELNRARVAFIGDEGVARILASGGDPNQALKHLGVCMAYSILFRDVFKMTPAQASTVVHPLSVCPSVGPNNAVLPKLYEANPDAAIHKIRDDAMLKAAGKKL